MANKKKNKGGIVYSTNPNFDYEAEQEYIEETLNPDKQNLRISLDRKQRKGKTVTLITGFIGSENDLKELGKKLKATCGTGGSVKDQQIIIQGDFKNKICAILDKLNYKYKTVGG